MRSSRSARTAHRKTPAAGWKGGIFVEEDRKSATECLCPISSATGIGTHCKRTPVVGNVCGKCREECFPISKPGAWGNTLDLFGGK